MGATNEATAFILAMIFTISLALIGLMITRGRNAWGALILTDLSLMVFIVMQWLSYWILLFMVLQVAFMGASKIGDLFGGK